MHMQVRRFEGVLWGDRARAKHMSAHVVAPVAFGGNEHSCGGDIGPLWGRYWAQTKPSHG